MNLSAQSTRITAAARLDRLPITAFHRRIMWILGIVFFFELGDINTFAFAAPAVMLSWHLSISTISHIVSATFIGMFLGATTGGWFADRVGRKRALILTTLWYSGFSLLNAFVGGPAGLFTTRLLTGVGLSAMTVVGITYVSEIFPAALRGAYQGWIMTIGLFGIPMTAYVARFTIPLAPWGWRLVFVWGALGLLVLLLANRLEESPRWYENRGLLAEADAALARIEADAQAEFGDLPPVLPMPHVSLEPLRRGGYRDLFAPSYLPRTVMLVAVWVCQTLGFYGFTAWVPTLLVAHGFSLVHSLAWSSAMTIGAVPGALIAALISDRWERKWWIAIVSLLIAFCGLMYGLTFRIAAIVIFGFLVAMFLQTFAPLLYAYTPECYPTRIRSSGSGLGYGIGRLSNVFGPLIVAFLFDRDGYKSVFVYVAAMWLLVAVIVAAFGPSTKGRALA
ncbi:MAG TPA: MFS transporter [Candidatus Acidoferrales bacterium]|nr:MFS transporter [Candidatus Acidoferrales bacterium]